MSRLLLCAIALSAAGCATTYPARGLVLQVDPAESFVVVSHDEIPGFMHAMVMPFIAAPGEELTGVQPGDRIAFRIRVKDKRTQIDRVRLLSAARVDAGLLTSPSKPVLVPIGGRVPDFTLTNQHNQSISLASLRGKVVAVTFIYTRCPLPDYCPRMIANLDAVRRRFTGQLGQDLVLLTVSFDPKHDTPDRLRAYAGNFRADVPGWHFLTGTSEQIEKVCHAFGVEYYPDEGLITHTLQTAVIDREGKLAAVVEGKDYTPGQLVDLVGSVLDREAVR